MIVFANWSPPNNLKDEHGESEFEELTDVISPDRWEIYDMINISADKSDNGEPDRILKLRPNPHHNPDWVKPKRFANLDY